MQITFSCKTTTLDYAKTELSSYIRENELKFQPYLDVYRLMDISTNYTGFKSI